MNLASAALVALIAAVAASAGVALVRRWALRGGAIDVPNERSSHSRPTPRGGGVAIVLVTLAGLLVLAAWQQFQPLAPVLVFVASAAGIAAISWWDDLHTLPSSVRFAVHAAAAVAVVAAIGAFDQVTLPLLGVVHLGWLGVAAAIFWLVAMTNVYNFMDGIDGLAGSQALLAGIGWVLLTAGNDQQANPVLPWLGLLLAASSAGFLLFNWPPARIFMGDVGSAFLGFSLGTLAVWGSRSDPALALAGVLVVWPFVFDSTFTIFRRLRKGENILRPHRSHLYQRLVIAGYSHRSVTLLYATLALLGVTLALAWQRGWPGSDWACAVLVPLAAFGLWRFVVRTETAARR